MYDPPAWSFDWINGGDFLLKSCFCGPKFEKCGSEKWSCWLRSHSASARCPTAPLAACPGGGCGHPKLSVPSSHEQMSFMR
eukprot:s1718_g4.t1